MRSLGASVEEPCVKLSTRSVTEVWGRDGEGERGRDRAERGSRREKEGEDRESCRDRKWDDEGRAGRKEGRERGVRKGVKGRGRGEGKFREGKEVRKGNVKRVGDGTNGLRSITKTYFARTVLKRRR